MSADPTPIGLSVADIADIPEDEILNPAENMYMAPVDLNAEDVTADAADIMNNKYGAAVSDNNKNAYDAKKGIFDFTESNSADGEFFTGYSNKVVAPQPNYGSIKFGKNYIKALVKVNTTQEKVDAAAANKDDVEANPTVFTFETDKGGSVSMKLSDVKTPGEWEYFTAGIDILPNWRTYESRDSENAGKEKEAWLEGYENADDVKISGIYHKTADAAFQSITVSSFETIDEEYDADRANETIALIEKLGADSSAAQVEAARISYDKLTKAQKELVGEQAYARLAAAEEKVESDKQAAKVVAEMIAALGAKPDDAAVKAAREAYDKLTESQKKLVENINLLTEAENAIAAAAENVKKANAVIALINSLSKNPSKAKAAEARNAYNKLTAEQKAMVTNLNQLIAAEKKIAEASKPVVKKVVIKKGKKTVKKLTVRKKTSKLKLKAVVSGKNLTVKDKKVKWKTSNKKLATVKAGTVKLKKAGKVKITASCKGKKAVVTIKIKK